MGVPTTIYFVTFYFRPNVIYFRNIFVEVRVGHADESQAPRQNPVAGNTEYSAFTTHEFDVSVHVKAFLYTEKKKQI